ncbi:MAG: hypothetical protein EAZ92_15740 [Candidatus Kapaibacterium sp.]|nr:MAG: hypothetical protein EAZ92_15740 [Candidatus Kapabacteria bacterium]
MVVSMLFPRYFFLQCSLRFSLQMHGSVLVFCLLCVYCMMTTPPALHADALVDSLTRRVEQVRREAPQGSTKLADALCDLANAYRTANTTVGIEFATQAIRLSEQLEYPQGLAQSYRILGWLRHIEGDYAAAMEAYLQGQKVAELSNLHIPNAQLIQYKGILFRAVSSYERALEEHLRALSLLQKAYQADKILDSAVVMDVYQELGIDYRLLGNAAKGREYLLKTLTYFTQQRDTLSLAITLNNLGECSLAEGRKYEALEALQLSLFYAEKLKHERTMIFNYTSLARLYLALNDVSRAVKYGTLALDLAQQRREKAQIRGAYQVLGDSYFAMGTFQEAHKYEHLAAVYQDSLYQTNIRNNFALQQTDLEMRKKEAQILLLEKDKERQRIVIIALSIGLLLVGIIAALFYRNIRQERRANTEITRQQALVQEQAAKIQQTNELLHEKNIQLETAKLLAEDNAQMLEDAYNSVKVLSAIGQKITSTLDLKSIGLSLYDDINRVINAPIVVIGTYSPEREEIEYTLTIENRTILPNYMLSLQERERAAVQCVMRREMVLVDDFQQQPLHGDAPRSLVYFPLIQASGKLIGVASAQSYERSYFTEHRLNFLRTIVPFITSALSNANAYRELAKVSEQAHSVNNDLQTVIGDIAARNLELQALNTEKSEIISIVAHDLKNPIAAIAGLTEVLASPTLEEEMRQRIVKQMSVITGRMSDLVKNILDAYRSEVYAAPLNLCDIDIVSLTATTVELYNDRAEAKNIHLHFLPEQETMRALADAQRLTQVLENLISNALKYSPTGKQVFVMVRTADTASIRIEVRDEGPGISADDMKQLFGKFARLSARPTAGEHSTGLGLSIVKQMVQSMNGKVWCESIEGNGARFFVDVPSAIT